jgi:SagB-type dehydrogenase family enzyme
LSGLVLQTDGVNAIMAFQTALYRLISAGILCYTLHVDGVALCTLVPLSESFMFRRRRIDANAGYVLSRFACIRLDGDALVAESPIAPCRVLLHAPAAVAVISRFASAVTADDLAGDGLLGEIETACALVNLLVNAAVVVAAGAERERHDAPTDPLGWWEFHDALFHARSRLGRAIGPYGGTFHRRGITGPLPMSAPPRSTTVLPLTRPDVERLAHDDAPFSQVLEARRSVRDYGEQPISAGQLGEFLFRVARVQQRLPIGGEGTECSLRPSPAGGAIHELEIYPVVGACTALAAGVYRYDPVGHALEAVAELDNHVAELLTMGWLTADRRSPPQVLLVITARFQRLQWKYQSMVYSVVLKDVGALYQTMYLVATAMGLAPCALGGGSADLFCRIAGLDYHAESQVGEFLLGSKGP